MSPTYKPGFSTWVVVVLDRSGSMHSCRKGVVDGFNDFVAKQRETPGDGWWSLYTFDSQQHATAAREEFPHAVYDRVPQPDVPPLTAEAFAPRGDTALRDAVCVVLDRVEATYDRLPPTERPDGVLVMVMTDGLENASVRFSEAAMQSTIRRLESERRWQVLFTGANQDARVEGAKYGIMGAKCLNYVADNEGAVANFANVERAVRSWKADGNPTADCLVTPCDPDPVAPTAGPPGTN